MLAVLGSMVLSARKAGSPSQTFSVHLGTSSAALKRFDNSVVTRCFGSSHAATAMRSDWQRELTSVKSDLDPEYVRFHGLLNDDMSVVIPGRRRKKSQPGAEKRTRGPQNCTFVKDQDFRDVGAGVVNASTKEECCRQCYTGSTGLPQPCVAAVWTEAGQCYFKIGDEKPYAKPGSGIWSCITDRPSAHSYEYSWTNIFTVFDFLISIGMRPIVEVSFMPELLASNVTLTNTVFHYKGILSPPKAFSEWREFMTAFGSAMIERYGVDEVRKWYFEVWNEPNCCGGYPDTGCCGLGCGSVALYTALFANTYAGLKKADERLKVGGPATAQLAWLDSFVEHATAAGTPPDFVSSHLYPTDPVAHETPLKKGRDDFASAIADAASIVAGSAKRHGIATELPLLLTEFNCGLGKSCADSFYSASFIAQHALNSQAYSAKVPVQSYWTFSDIFEEGGQSPYEFSNAFGTRSFNGIPKPVYRGMQLVKRLGDRAFPVSETSCSAGFNCTGSLAVTTASAEMRNGLSTIEALLVNHPLGPVDMATDPSLPAVAITVKFTGGSMPGRVDVRRVDNHHANALLEYETLGQPDYPNATIIAALKRASEVMVKAVVPVACADGGWEVTILMPAFSVASLSFERR